MPMLSTFAELLTKHYLKEHHNELLEKVAYVDIGNPNEEYDYRFSIIMPVYNCRTKIGPAIDRILNQSYQKFELIIMDDGSEDGTFEYLNEQYGHEIETGKIRLVRTEHNGVSGARNAGLKEAKNNWIASLKFVTIGQIVDESKIIKRELLSELALILGMLNEATTEKEILTEIKRVKGIDLTLFAYKVINENGRLGVEIFLNTKIMDVTGFPFKAFVGDHVNNLVEANVRFKE